MKLEIDLNVDSNDTLNRVVSIIKEELQRRKAPKKASTEEVEVLLAAPPFSEGKLSALPKKQLSPSQKKEKEILDCRQRWWDRIVKEGWSHLTAPEIFKKISENTPGQSMRVHTDRGVKKMSLMWVVRLRQNYVSTELRPTPIEPDSKAGKLLYKKEKLETEEDLVRKTTESQSQALWIKINDNLNPDTYRDSAFHVLNMKDIVYYAAKGKTRLTYDYAVKFYKWVSFPLTDDKSNVVLAAVDRFEQFLKVNKKLLEELGIA